MALSDSGRLGRALEASAIPVGALLAAMVVFGLFVAVLGKNPLEVYALMYRGAFGSGFAWQNSLVRAAPLILTALCVAMPAQAGGSHAQAGLTKMIFPFAAGAAKDARVPIEPGTQKIEATVSVTFAFS